MRLHFILALALGSSAAVRGNAFGQSPEPADQDNRFIEATDFRATYTTRPAGFGPMGNLNVTFVLRNVSPGGISVFLDHRQYRALRLDHPDIDFSCPIDVSLPTLGGDES